VVKIEDIIRMKQQTMNMKAKVSPIIATNISSNFEISLMTRKYVKNLSQQTLRTKIIK
jgi:hypothetical protein